MNELEVLPITKTHVERLKQRLIAGPAVFPVSRAVEFASWLVSYGIAREIGTVNDELARFVFDAETGVLVPRDSLKADVVTYAGHIGVRIYSQASTALEVRIKGFRNLCHPKLSENPDASYRHIVIFPEIVAQVAALEGIELVVVKQWGLNSIFGGFEPEEGYYETNLWELENNDSALFASLVETQRLAFLGTHDLIAHVAGLNGGAWNSLQRNAAMVKSAIAAYVGSGSPTMANLVFPYTAGVILDDLAQPPSYFSASHHTMLVAVLKAMAKARPPVKNAVLLRYPDSFAEIIRLSRDKDLTARQAEGVVSDLVQELNATTACFA